MADNYGAGLDSFMTGVDQHLEEKKKATDLQQKELNIEKSKIKLQKDMHEAEKLKQQNFAQRVQQQSPVQQFSNLVEQYSKPIDPGLTDLQTVPAPTRTEPQLPAIEQLPPSMTPQATSSQLDKLLQVPADKPAPQVEKLIQFPVKQPVKKLPAQTKAKSVVKPTPKDVIKELVKPEPAPITKEAKSIIDNANALKNSGVSGTLTPIESSIENKNTATTGTENLHTSEHINSDKNTSESSSQTEEQTGSVKNNKVTEKDYTDIQDDLLNTGTADLLNIKDDLNDFTVRSYKNLNKRMGDLSFLKNRLAQYLKQPIQQDLTPLAALVDSLTGSNFTKSYKRPRTQEEYADLATSLSSKINEDALKIDELKAKLLENNIGERVKVIQGLTGMAAIAPKGVERSYGEMFKNLINQINGSKTGSESGDVSKSGTENKTINKNEVQTGTQVGTKPISIPSSGKGKGNGKPLSDSFLKDLGEKQKALYTNRRLLQELPSIQANMGWLKGTGNKIENMYTTMTGENFTQEQAAVDAFDSALKQNAYLLWKATDPRLSNQDRALAEKVYKGGITSDPVSVKKVLEALDWVLAEDINRSIDNQSKAGRDIGGIKGESKPNKSTKSAEEIQLEKEIAELENMRKK